MSYDVWLTVIQNEAGDETTVIDVGNYTSNVADMWREALGGERGLADVIEASPVAHSLVAPLFNAVTAMEIDPETYRAMNPDNGWGDYEGALDYLRRIADACRTMSLHPACFVRVSR